MVESCQLVEAVRQSELRPDALRFGVFEFDLRARELRKQGMRIRLLGQPVEILAMLVERPGEVVTREELQKKLWPGDTFVDFEHGLNAAIKRLRDALGDDAENPRFVETLPRLGYRFIAAVNGAERSPSAEVAAQAPPISGVRLGLWVPAFAVLAIVVVVGVFLGMNVGGWRDRLLSRASTARIHSVAVLPLENLSGNPEEDYFADGMTDALIAELGKVSALRVISRQSVMRYKGSKKPLREIARELNVDALVEGSVLHSGDRVRVVANLIDASNDQHLWAEMFDRKVSDILALQSDFAESIAREVQAKLTSQERAQLTKVRPVNPEAHEAYLRGLYFWNKFSIPALNKSLEYFQQAIDKDPGYAQGYAGLAASYSILGNFGVLPPREAYPKAKAAAKKALEIDEGLSEAHSQLGWETLLYERDWTGAEREFRRAIELNPSNANARDGLAMYLAALGRLDGAVAEIRRARDLDPLSLVINGDVGMILFFARQYDQALDHLQKTREMDPSFPPTYLHMGHAYEAKGMPEEAYQMYLKSMTLSGGPQKFRAALEQAHAKGGWRGAWQKAIDLVRQLQARGEYPDAYGVAERYMSLGDKNQALDWLLKAADERTFMVVFAKVDPRFDGLRSEPRFAELLRRIGLPP